MTKQRKIFLAAADITDEGARSRYLDETCANDPELRTKIEQLLVASDSAGDFLDQPPPGLALTLQSDIPDEYSDLWGDISLDFLTPSAKPGCLGGLGDYEIVGLVGRGAFGIVLRAYDTKLNRIVAIKVMAPDLARNPMAVKRFLREAQAAAAVTHDHIVTIHAIEESNKPPFIVMEYVEGESLKEKVDREGALGLDDIIRIGAQMADGLAAAHGRGLVHRDIKPANILLENGIKRVKITDFGLARAVDDVGMTQTGMITGTPQFMSPEQALGQPVDARSDLFSLGSVLYTLCTGRPAFRAEGSVATLRRVCDDEPRSIRKVNRNIPGWFEQFVMRLLEKKANNRFQSATEVRDLLNSFLIHQQNGDPATPPAAASSFWNGQHSFSRKGRSWTKTLYQSLIVLQMIAMVVAIFAALVEGKSCVFFGRVFGVGVGAVLTGMAAFWRLPWVNIAFGLSSIVGTFLIVAAINLFGFNPGDTGTIAGMIAIYATFGLPLGWLAIRGAQRVDAAVWDSTAPRKLSATVYISLLFLQVIGVCVGFYAAFEIDSESVLFTMPVFGFGCGLLLAITAAVGRLGRSALLLGLYSIAATVLLFLCVSAHQYEPVLASLALYLAVLIPWATRRIVALSPEARPFRNLVYFVNSKRVLCWLLGLEILGAAFGVANCAIEVESTLLWFPIFGVLIPLWLIVFLFTGRVKDRFTFTFIAILSAMAVYFAFMVINAPSWSFPGKTLAMVVSEQATISAWCLLPVGLIAFAREMEILPREWSRNWSQLPRFSIKSMMIGTALCGLAVAYAQPCLAFGANGMFAGTLASGTLITLVIMLGWWMHKKGWSVKFWVVGMSVAAFVLLMSCSVFVRFYDAGEFGLTDNGHIRVSTPIPIKVAILSQKTNRHVTWDFHPTPEPMGTLMYGLDTGVNKFSIAEEFAEYLDMEPTEAKLGRQHVIDVKITPKPGVTPRQLGLQPDWSLPLDWKMPGNDAPADESEEIGLESEIDAEVGVEDFNGIEQAPE